MRRRWIAITLFSVLLATLACASPPPEEPDIVVDMTRIAYWVGPIPDCGTKPTREHAEAVWKRYSRKIHDLPNVVSTYVDILRNVLGERWDGWVVGIIVGTTEYIDQSTLPPEDRIPECLEGVPVQFEYHPPIKPL